MEDALLLTERASECDDGDGPIGNPIGNNHTNWYNKYLKQMY